MSKDLESNLEAGRYNPKDIVKDAADDNQAADKMKEMVDKLSNEGSVSSSGTVTINEQKVDNILKDYLKPNAANQIGRELKANKRDGFAMFKSDQGLPWREYNEGEGKKPSKKMLMAIGIRAGAQPNQIKEEIRSKFSNAPNYVLNENQIRRWIEKVSAAEGEGEMEATVEQIARCILQQGGWRAYWWGWQHDVPDRTCATDFANYLVDLGIGPLIATLGTMVAGSWIAGIVGILILVLRLFAAILGYRIRYLLNAGSNGVILTGLWIPTVWAVRR